MFNITKLLSTGFVSFVLFSSLAHAQSITHTFGGTADFSINGTSSNNIAFEISANSDISNVTANVFDPNLLFVNHDSATIDLGALGLFVIDDPSSTFVNQTTGVVGLGDANAGLTEFSLEGDPSFNSYDLTTPFSGPSLAVDSNAALFNVSNLLGISTISIDNFVGPVGFTATPISIPEPSAICMIALSGLGLATYRRRII